MDTRVATGKESTGTTVEVSTDVYEQSLERFPSNEAEHEQHQTDRDESQPTDATSFLVGVIQTVSDALDAAREKNEELHEENEELREDHEQLRDEFHTYRNAVQTKFERIEETTEIHDSRLDAVADGIDRVEAQSSAAESGEQTEETTFQRRETPIERLLDAPMDSDVEITSSVQRAMRIVGNFRKWSNERERTEQ